MELSLLAEDAAFFPRRGRCVSVFVLGVWCCVWLWQVEKGMYAAVGLSGRGAEGSRRGASRQHHSQLEL